MQGRTGEALMATREGLGTTNEVLAITREGLVTSGASQAMNGASQATSEASTAASAALPTTSADPVTTREGSPTTSGVSIATREISGHLPRKTRVALRRDTEADTAARRRARAIADFRARHTERIGALQASRGAGFRVRSRTECRAISAIPDDRAETPRLRISMSRGLPRSISRRHILPGTLPHRDPQGDTFLRPRVRPTRVGGSRATARSITELARSG